MSNIWNNSSSNNNNKMRNYNYWVMFASALVIFLLLQIILILTNNFFESNLNIKWCRDEKKNKSLYILSIFCDLQAASNVFDILQWSVYLFFFKEITGPQQFSDKNISSICGRTDLLNICCEYIESDEGFCTLPPELVLLIDRRQTLDVHEKVCSVAYCRMLTAVMTEPCCTLLQRQFPYFCVGST